MNLSKENTAVKSRDILTQVSALEAEIGALENLFVTLHDRLQIVRRNEPDHNVEAAKEMKDPSLSCELAEILRKQVVRIINLCDRMNISYRY